jgi:lipopolysaccharide/colanic/teichoic acid biosynthesis glycosyltransferase
MRRFLLLALTDLILLLAAFGLVHLVNYGHLNISGTSQDLLKFQVLVWLGASLIARKFSRIPELSFIMGSGLLLKTGVAIMFVLSLVIVGLHYTHFSRTMAYGTIIVFVLLEIGVLALYQWIRGPVPHPGRLTLKSGPLNINRSLFLLDGALLVLSFFAVTYLKRGSIYLANPYDDILLILLGLWLVFSLFTRKFIRENFNDVSNALGPAIRTALFMAAGLTFLIYLFRLEPISRLQALGPIPLFLVLEGFIFTLYSNYRRHGRLEKDIEDAGEVRAMLDQTRDRSLPDPAPACAVNDPAEEKLRHALEFFDPGIFEFISKHLDLKKIDRCECALFNTDEMQNLNFLDQGKNSLIVNLHKLNDIRWFNRYFLLGHEKLRPGGYLVGKAHTTATQRDYYLNKYPGVTGQLLYGLKFIWGRICPKLPWVQKIYFSITKGRNRSVSRAEVLGRLIFCGFEIVAEKEIGHRFYFIARKIKRPSPDQSPTFGPLVRLKRTGLGGKPITVYKFRTMYPFSEYLQEYVFNMYGTKDGDKILNDFRITGWGRIFRKLWIDEQPMFYNWLRGDLKLVGVRPLSDHKLSTYPAELQEKRKKVKPGLLPPFYADRPDTVEGFFRAEEKYLDSYMKKPFRTDFKYFWVILWNIFVRKARSG